MNGQLCKDVEYDHDKTNGHVLTFWKNGKPNRVDSFSSNTFISGKCFNEAGSPISHFKYMEMPEFPGGESSLMSYLQRNIKIIGASPN